MTAAKALVTICALALAATASACRGSDNKKVDYVSGGTYTEALPTDPGNLHPLRASAGYTRSVLAYAYDSLISLDSQGHVIGRLAGKWKASPKRVTYTLRPGITCSDGTKLTASHVADTFEWIKDPKNESPLVAELLAGLDFTVKADDAARTVTVELGQPYGFLLQGAGLIPIVCPKGLADPKSLAKGTDGTGPFELTDYVADDHLTLRARKDYRWGPDGASADVAGFPAKVVIKVVSNETTVANLLLSGGLNAGELGGPERARLNGQDMQTLSSLEGPNDIFFNQRSGHPGADADVRKALAMALDLDQLAKVVAAGAGERPPGLAIQSPRACPYNSVNGALPAHDSDAAKALLDDAGWIAGSGGTRTKGGRPLAVTLLYESTDPAVSAGMELVAQWWKELGVDVKLDGQGGNAYVQTMFAGNAWDVVLLNLGAPFPNQLVPYASGPASPKGQNIAAIDDAEYARLANQALGTTGPDGCDLWRKAEQSLFRDVDVVPASARTEKWFVTKARVALGVAGIEPTSVRLLAH
jgi:peptide/nickel transport system substrate-binding protein